MLKGNPNIALGILFVIGLMNYVDRIAFSILQIPIKTDLHLSDAELGALTGLAFSIPYVLLTWPVSRMADRGNRKNLLAAVLAIWSIGTALISVAQGFVSLVILRMGVAVGEAACLPTSYSLLADYFPVTRRGKAIAIFILAYPIGSMLGLIGGGAMGSAIGWRMSFLVIGLFGLALAPIVFATLNEPARGGQESQPPDPDAIVPTIPATIALLWNLRVFRYLALATSLQSYVVYTLINWSAPYYVRVHHLGLTEVALLLGIVTGVGGATGNYLGGALGDRLALLDRRWYIWTPALACVLLVPIGLAQFTVGDAHLSLAIGIVSNMLATLFMPPIYAVIQSLVAPNIRAFATGTLVALTALIGGALGPFMTGALSDLFSRHFGAAGALRYAICSSLVFSVLAAWFFREAAAWLHREMEFRDRAALAV